MINKTIELLTIYNLKEMSLSAELFLSCSILQLTFFGICTTYQRKHGYVILTNQVYSISILIVILTTLLVLNEDIINNSFSSNNSIINDYLSFITKLFTCLATIAFLIVAKISIKNDEPKQHNFEYVILILVSLLGLLLLCSANDLMTAYLAIELQSIAFYIMAAFKKNSSYSIESGLKYFIIGSLSSALFLFGSSLIYGCLGSLNFNDFKMFLPLLSISTFSNEIKSNSFDIFNFITEYLIKKQEVELYLILLEQPVFGHIFMFGTAFNICSSASLLPNTKVDIEDIADMFHEPFNPIHTGKFVILNDHLLSSVLTLSFNNDNLLDWYLEKYEETNFINEIFYNYCTKSKNIVNLLYMLFHDSYLEVFENTTDPYIYYTQIYKSFHYYIDRNLLKDEVYYLKYHDDFNLPFTFYEGLQVYFDKRYSNYSFLDNFTYDKSNESLFFLSKIKTNFFKNLSYTEIFLNNNIKENYLLSLVSIGFILIFISIFIKLAVAPFHLWSLDVYEGSPNVTTFFFLVIPKLAILVLLIRICYSSFYQIFIINQTYFFIFAILSIFVGALGGLEQRKVKTLLAYSSINHTGYLLLAFSTGTIEGMVMSIYYVIIYMLSGLCFWSVYLFLNKKQNIYFNKYNKELGDFVLLKESNPMLAFILSITLFSMAGIPPLIGFLAKTGVFLAVINSSAYFLALIGILLSVISTFYYIRFIKILYFENVLVGKLYAPVSSKKALMISILFLLLISLIVNPTILYLLIYKAILLFNI